MADNILLRKAQIIERCLRRIAEVYGDDERNLLEDLTKQDSILLNLERACQAAIDAGNRMVRLRRLGMPQESKDVFALLERDGVITAKASAALRAMVGFRNVAVHDYQELKLEVVRGIIANHLDDLRGFAGIAVKFS